MRRNIEAMLIAYLRGLGFEAYAEIPSERPEEFVVVERIGGDVADGYVDVAYVLVDCYAGSRLAAADLVYRVDSVMRDFELAEGVRRVDLGAITNVSDMPSGTGLYEASYQIFSQVIEY